MTYRHFSIFLAVCDTRNMTKAAGQLHMTQPAVSQAIGELEAHYAARLFERLGRKLYITKAGQRLLTYARHIVHLHVQAEEEMRRFGALYRVRLGATVTIGSSVLLRLLLELDRLHPDNQIVSLIQNTAVLENMLLDDALDLALIEGEVHAKDLKTEIFLSDTLIPVAAPQHPLSACAAVEPRQLARERFFVRETGSGTRERFDETMRAHGLSYQACGIYNNTEAIKRAVALNLGVSVLSERSVREEIARGTLCRLPLRGMTLQRHFRLVYHKNKYISPELEEILSICRQGEIFKPCV